MVHQGVHVALFDSQLVLFNNVLFLSEGTSLSIISLRNLISKGATDVKAFGDQLFFWSVTCFDCLHSTIL
jgi:hypothetical protein